MAITDFSLSFFSDPDIPSGYKGTLQTETWVQLISSSFINFINIWSFFLLLYFLLLKSFPKIEKNEKNVSSLVHSSIAALASIPIVLSCNDYERDPNIIWWSTLLFINAISYFLMDSIFSSSLLWRVHHLVAIIMHITGLFSPWLVGCIKFYWYAEIGGIAYHISNFNDKLKNSLIIRSSFIIIYTISRYYLVQKNYHALHYGLTEKYSDLYFYSGLLQHIMGDIVCILNLYFLFKQTKYLKKMIVNKMKIHSQKYI